MKIFQRIAKVKKHVAFLKAQLKLINDQKKMDQQVMLINDVIQLVNDVEFMIETEISPRVIDKLILAHMHTLFNKYESDEGIALHEVVGDIDDIINYPISLQKDKLIDFLKDAEQTRILNEIPVTQDTGNWQKFGIVFPKSQIDFSRITQTQFKEVYNSFCSQVTKKEYGAMVDDLLSQFKQQIKWN